MTGAKACKASASRRACHPEGARGRAWRAVPALQAAIGNQTLGRLLQPIRPKLRVSAPDDPSEREADRTAEVVLDRKAGPCHCGGVCPACRDGAKPVLMRQGDGRRGSAGVPDGLLAGLGPGRSLDTGTRAFFESRFGQDLSGVRVHTEGRAAASAEAVDALAFTAGRDVVFGPGQYAPHSEAGRRLLAHELVHVVQQEEAGTPALQRKITVKDPSVNIPNPGGKGVVQTNAATVEDYAKTLCPDAAAGIAVDPKSGEVSLAAAFCTEAPLPPGFYGPPAPAPAQLSAYRTGCGCLCDLSTSAHTWQVEIDDAAWPHTVFDNATDAITPGVGTGGVVTAPSPNSPKLWGAATASGKALNIDPWLVLGHELCGHAWLGNWGAHGPDELLPRGEGGHQATVARENLLRAEHGIELRGTFKQPYCGESFWRDRAKRGTVHWSSYLSTCKAWRAAYNRVHGTKYKISDTIP